MDERRRRQRRAGRLSSHGDGGDGISDYDQLVGDYTNPILQPWAAEVVKKFGEMSLAGIPYGNPSSPCWLVLSGKFYFAVGEVFDETKLTAPGQVLPQARTPPISRMAVH